MSNTTHIFARILLAFSLLLAGVAGCNTIKGAGEDLKKTGEAIEDAID